MAASAEVVTVTDEATALNSASPLPLRLVIGVPSADIHIGGSDVDNTDGWALVNSGGAVFTVTVSPGDVLYAVTATTATVSVLRT